MRGTQFRKAAAVVIAVAMGVTTALTIASPQARAATGDIGYADQTYTGVSKPPTSDKPQSKLWFNDGLWWATMWDSASLTWHIFRLDRQTEKWVDTGTQVDDRKQSLPDALWDGNKLYVASQWATVSTNDAPYVSVSGRPARLYRFSYDSASKTYSRDTGFPVNINNYSSESLTLDKDSTGELWATWTQVSGSSTTGYVGKVYVNSSQGSDSVWGTPQVLPVTGAASASPDDISAVVAFARSKIGVMWSNEADDTMYWAVHNDGAPDTSWQGSVALRGPKQSDDHMNLKTIQADQAGRVYAAVKTSLDELAGSTSSDPQIRLLAFKPGTGSWSSTTFGTLADCHTRPIVMLDEENSEVHVFATGPSSSTGCPFSGAPGTIYEKVAPMDNPVFSAGRGTPVIRDAANANMNNATSTKQSVNGRTGLVVLASNTSTSRYWHADLELAQKSTTVAPTASFTASPTSGSAPLDVSFTDTSSGSPTSWSWDFGDGGTSTAQSPTHTYSTAGTYTVKLTASNSAGADSTTSTITVSSAPSTSDYRSLVLGDNPVGYWRLADTDTNVAAEVGPNGTARGGVTSTTGVLADNAARALNGSTGYLAIPDAAALDPTGDLSVEAWAKPTAVQTGRVVQKSGSVWQYRLGMTSTGQWRGAVYVGTRTYEVSDPAAGQLGVWTHLVMTRSDGTLSLYVNGKLVDTAAMTGANNVSTGTLAIGRAGSSGSSYFPGNVDEVAVYDHALAPSAVSSHFWAATP